MFLVLFLGFLVSTPAKNTHMKHSLLHSQSQYKYQTILTNITRATGIQFTPTYFEASSLFRTWEVFSLALMYRGFLLLVSTSCSLAFFSRSPTSRDHLAASCFLAFSCASILPRRLVWRAHNTLHHTQENVHVSSTTWKVRGTRNKSTTPRITLKKKRVALGGIQIHCTHTVSTIIGEIIVQRGNEIKY